MEKKCRRRRRKKNYKVIDGQTIERDCERHTDIRINTLERNQANKNAIEILKWVFSSLAVDGAQQKMLTVHIYECVRCKM